MSFLANEFKILSNDKVRDLCLRLMQSDSELQVISILKDAGFWDNDHYWRLYGDHERNFSVINVQQDNSIAALVEKIENAIDARLIFECLRREIDPESELAPQTVAEAVALFFPNNRQGYGVENGKIKNWTKKKRSEEAKYITLCTTGFKSSDGFPSITIADAGEGQTPRKMPSTLLSLLAGRNKEKIPFVQGKFNMGGTGALAFCGKHNLQLIISRRYPKLIKPLHDVIDSHWGFTIVRRENPRDGKRTSVYTYLAPYDGQILSFESEDMPIFPDGPCPYHRKAHWGTLIKLYEYEFTGDRSHILWGRNSLLNRLDLLLPEISLPVRLHECREFGGAKERSFETTLSGICVRLEENRDNIEDGFPIYDSIVVGEQYDERLDISIYAFKEGKAKTYRLNEGVLFVQNGQTHGSLPTLFFKNKVLLDYLADSLLVIVNCDRLSLRARELLFMNNRVHLRDGLLYNAIKDELQHLLRNNQSLRQLAESRRRQMLEAKIGNSKPLENILKSVIETNPVLSNLFLSGTRLSNPLKPTGVSTTEKPFKGRTHPSYFRFLNVTGSVIERNCHLNQRCQLRFETDVVNDYFQRDVYPGRLEVFIKKDGQEQPYYRFNGPNLDSGIATISLILPDDASIDTRLQFLIKVDDETLIKPFINEANLKIKPPIEQSSGSKGKDRGTASKSKGTERKRPGGIELPKASEVYRDEWAIYGFDEKSALLIRRNPSSSFDFWVNMDNLYLQHELKRKPRKAEILKNRYSCGMVLVGLAIIHQIKYDEETKDKEDERVKSISKSELDITDIVFQISKAIAPIILPMIHTLGGLDLDQKLAMTTEVS